MTGKTTSPSRIEGARHAIVIGGSMGGLFIGNMLVRQGWRVDIFEKAEGALNVRGAGIAGHPELGPLLAAAGLDKQRPVGVDVAGRSAYDRTGRPIAFYPYPQYLTYWGLLHAMLRSAFPEAGYHAGVELTGLSRGFPQSVAHFSDGRSLAADLIIGADGIRSKVRSLLAVEIEPQYAGYFAFRGLVPEVKLSDRFRQEMMPRYVWMFPGDGQLNGYPICGADYAIEPGRRQYAYLWYRPVTEAERRDLLTDADGHYHDHNIPPPLIRPQHFSKLKAYAERQLPPLFAEMVLKAENDLLQPMYDVLSKRMAFGNIALLGDAAFVARPHVGIGVLKAGQDALALAQALAGETGVVEALQRYEAERMPPSIRAVQYSRHLGSFIERRLPHPSSDPALLLSPEYLLQSSARSVESVMPMLTPAQERLLGWV